MLVAQATRVEAVDTGVAAVAIYLDAELAEPFQTSELLLLLRQLRALCLLVVVAVLRHCAAIYCCYWPATHVYRILHTARPTSAARAVLADAAGVGARADSRREGHARPGDAGLLPPRRKRPDHLRRAPFFEGCRWRVGGRQ